MIRSVYLPEDGDIRQQLDDREIGHVLEGRDGLLWVDITEDESEARTLLRDRFGFHPLAIEDCFDELIDTAKVDDYGDYLFVVTPYAVYDRPSEQVNIRQLCAFLGPNYVVSVHQRLVQPVQDIFKQATTEPRILNRGADFLLHSLLDAVVDDLLPTLESIEEELDDLERAVLDAPEHRYLSSILLLKRNTLRLRRSLLSHRDMMNRLSRDEFPNHIRTETLLFFRDVYDHIVRAEQLIEDIRDLTDSALSYYLSAINNRMNEIMKALSVVAAVFLPLTLIASIFGTNLDYSSLGFTLDNGFFWMLGAMIMITVAMVLYFRYRGWF